MRGGAVSRVESNSPCSGESTKLFKALQSVQATNPNSSDDVARIKRAAASEGSSKGGEGGGQTLSFHHQRREVKGVRVPVLWNLPLLERLCERRSRGTTAAEERAHETKWGRGGVKSLSAISGSDSQCQDASTATARQVGGGGASSSPQSHT